MKYTIRVVDNAKGVSDQNKGAYVTSYNPDAHNGRGFAEFTRDIRKARKFDKREEAFLYWQQQSRVMPLRPDGKPNKPLTCYTVEIAPYPEDK